MTDDPSAPRLVREPVQVYLEPDDRALLDRVAADQGLSLAEVLRRGIRAYAATRPAASPMLGYLDQSEASDWSAPRDTAARHDEVLADALRPKRKRR